MTKSDMMMRNVPRGDRPRERLFRDGAAALSERELLAIVLTSGTRHESALELAGRLLSCFGGMEALSMASVQEVQGIRGIGCAKAAQLFAAFEIGHRMARPDLEKRYVIRSPEDGAQLVMEEMRLLSQEHFVTAFLDSKNQVIHKTTIFMGSLNSSLVHPREIFREAVRRAAASIVCFHNHPSGDPTPSREDGDVTRRLAACGKMLGIDLLDHIIIGNRQYVSLKQRGML
ncbi:MAG: DNA repair protein RadC [Sporolactobacillus sp.]